MKYLSNQKWEKLPIPKDDYRPRFFIELYQELLSADTPISFRPRTMNIITYASEIIELVLYYRKYSRGKSYIIRSFNEFFKYIEYDDVAKKIYKKEISALKNIDNKDIDFNSINKLLLLMKAILDSEKQKEYWNEIKNNIIKNLCIECESLEKKKRILDDIKKSTELLVSYMLNNLGSSSYLYHRYEQFIRKNNYKSRTWKAQIEKILNSFSIMEKEFYIYFLIYLDYDLKENVSETYSLDEFKINFSKRIDKKRLDQFLNQSKNREKNKDRFYVIKFKTNSYNYDTALSKIKEKLSTLDLVNVFHDIEVLPKALIVTSNRENLNHTNLVIIDNYLNSKSFLDLQENNLSGVLNVLNNESVNFFKSSLRYFRIAKQSKSVEQKLLNSWIAIETIYLKPNSFGNEGSIIDNIIYYVPLLYNSFSIIRKIRYAKELLVENNIPLSEKVCSNLNISSKLSDENISLNNIWKIIVNKDLFESLMMDVKELENMEHLKYRLTDIHNFVINKDNASGDKTKKIQKNFENNKILVENQLYRIYGIRNKIAHQGHYESINPQLVEHLIDYLMISYTAIAIGMTYLPKLQLHNDKFSLLDIFDIYLIQFQDIINNIESNKISDDIESVFVNYKIS